MPYALAVNCGSSSIKFQLYDDSLAVVIAGSASNVQGSAPARFTVKSGDGLKQKTDRTLEKDTPYEAVFDEILKEVRRLMEGRGEIGIVAHRIVHGGTATDPIVIHHGDADEQKVTQVAFGGLLGQADHIRLSQALDTMDAVSDFAPLQYVVSDYLC